MDLALSILEHLKDILASMKEQQATILTYMDKQTSMNERQTGLLTSINEHVAKLNASNLQNEFEDEDHMEKGKGELKVTKNEEQLDESPAPCTSSSSPYYRLEIEGVVGVEDQTQGTPDSHTKGKPAGTSHTLTSRSRLNIRVILKKDGEQVQKDDKLAKLRVQLVVLNDDFFIDDKHNSHPSWPQKDFTDSCLHLNVNNPTKKIMAVDKGEFRLTEGTGAPHKDATIKVNSNKKLVKLGVMIHPDDYHKLGATRVLEGVSNSFRVQDLPRANNKGGKTKQCATTGESLSAKVLGKRPMNGVSESSTSPQDPEWNSLASSSVGTTLINGCPTMPSQLENTETASRQHSEGLLLQAPSTMGNFSPTPPPNCTAGAHHAPRPHNLTMGLSKLANPITIGASSSVPHVPHQGNYGAPGGQRNDAQGNVVPATDSNMMDVQNSAPSGQSYVPNGINYDTGKVVSAAMAAVQKGNYYGPGGQSQDAHGNVLAATNLTTMNQQNTQEKRKRVNNDNTLQQCTSWSQFPGQVQSAQNFGQHATAEQLTQNCQTAPIGTPQAYAPNSDKGLTTSFQTKLDDNQGISFEEGYNVDPSSQNLMMGINPAHENLQGLQTQGQFGDMLQQGHPLEVPGPDMLGLIIGDAGILSSAEGKELFSLYLRCACSTYFFHNGLAESFITYQQQNYKSSQQPFSVRPFFATDLAELDGHLSSATQPKQTSTHSTRQPGNNSTGGAQGQPNTPWSNNLHTNSHGRIRTAATTNDFTSAQMDMNSTKDDLDVEMGGHEQGDGGRVGNGDYGGGNDGGRMGDEGDGDIWDLLSPIFPDPEQWNEDSELWHCTGTNP